MYAYLRSGAVAHISDRPDEPWTDGTPIQFDPAAVAVDFGFTYDAGTGVFSAPGALPRADRRITKLAFRNRFTQAEKITIELAALDNPAASMPARQQAAALRASLKDQENASYIDLDRADTRAGVQGLETAGILASGRALQILDAPIQDVERYKG
jgi:hypothetical protein